MTKCCTNCKYMYQSNAQSHYCGKGLLRMCGFIIASVKPNSVCDKFKSAYPLGYTKKERGN